MTPNTPPPSPQTPRTTPPQPRSPEFKSRLVLALLAATALSCTGVLAGCQKTKQEDTPSKMPDQPVIQASWIPFEATNMLALLCKNCPSRLTRVKTVDPMEDGIVEIDGKLYHCAFPLDFFQCGGPESEWWQNYTNTDEPIKVTCIPQIDPDSTNQE